MSETNGNRQTQAPPPLGVCVICGDDAYYRSHFGPPDHRVYQCDSCGIYKIAYHEVPCFLAAANPELGGRGSDARRRLSAWVKEHQQELAKTDAFLFCEDVAPILSGEWPPELGKPDR